jgi:hypothetical protein
MIAVRASMPLASTGKASSDFASIRPSRNEATAHAVVHHQDTADRLSIVGEPEGTRWLAAALGGWKRLALDENAPIHERLDDAGDRGAVDPGLAGELGSARRPQVEKRLEHASAVHRADGRGGNQGTASDRRFAPVPAAGKNGLALVEGQTTAVRSRNRFPHRTSRRPAGTRRRRYQSQSSLSRNA